MHVPADRPTAAAPDRGQPPRTGLERECLRQAIHDVRGPLNTSSVLVDLIGALLDRDPELARTKAPAVVRELQTVARMLDHLVGTSDTLATDTTSLDLAPALHDAVAASAPPGVTVDVDVAPTLVVAACAARLPRLCGQLLERCGAALPDGGAVRVTATADGGRVQVVVVAHGPRMVLPPEGRPHLAAAPPAAGWFTLLALARGLGGDLRIGRDDRGALRVEVDLIPSAHGHP